MDDINRADYPTLDLLLWDIHARTIAPNVAFQIYERRWSYVDEKKISTSERELINLLTIEFGKGIFMPLLS